MQFFHKTGTIRLRDVCSHRGLRPSALVQMLPFLAHPVWGGQAGRDGGDGQCSPPEHALATMMMWNLPSRHPQGVRARSRLRLFLLSLSSYKRAGVGLPAEAHGGTRSPQGAPTLLVASFHLHSLCSKAPAKPVLLSLRDPGRKQAGMATSSGREHPGPESSPSATLSCRKAD